MRALVIIVRGCHAGYLGAYGNDWIATPALNRLAAEGVVFDQHYADRPDAPGAWHAWRTGRYGLPAEDGRREELPEDECDLLRLLRDQGVGTALVAHERQRASKGQDESWDSVRIVAVGDDHDVIPGMLPAVAQFLDRWAEQNRWLLWLELSTLVPPWQVPESHPVQPEEELGDEETTSPDSSEAHGRHATRRLQSAYARTVSYVDSGIGYLVDELEEGGWLDDVLLVISSDHGLALGEHGGAGRAPLRDEVIHLPLILRLPSRAEAGRRVFALTQAVDLLPTLLDFFQVSAPAAVHGRSLWPLVRGETEEVRAYACSGISAGDTIEWALRTPTWAFVVPLGASAGGRRLYVRPEDRWEVNNVLQHHLELADQFERTLREFAKAACAAGPLHAPVLPDIDAELTSAVAPEEKATP